MTITPKQSRRLTLGLYTVAFIATVTLGVDPPMWVYLLVMAVCLPYTAVALWLLMGELVTNRKADF